MQKVNDLPSSSTTVTVAWWGSSTVMFIGSEDELMVR